MRLFILVALIALCLAAPSAPDSDLDVCGNPFLPKLKGSVEVFSKTVFGSFSHCQHEWNTEGTCCNENDLVKFFTEETESIRASMQSTNKVFRSIHKVFIDFTNAMTEVHLTEKDHDQPEFARKIEGYSHQSFLDDFEAAAEKCWNHMIGVRGSALCSICSGRGEDFFKGKKILIGMEDCKVTVHACKNFFVDFDSLIADLNALAKTMKKESEFSIDTEVNNLNGLVKKLKIPQDLISSFKKFDSVESHQQDRLAAGICYMIMDIRKEPVVATVASSSALKKSVKVLKGLGRKGARGVKNILKSKGKGLLKIGRVKNVFKKAKSSLAKAKAGTKPTANQPSKTAKPKTAKSRLLGRQLAKNMLPPNLEFEADSLTVMRESDDMFHSFEGAEGSYLSFACSDYKIMNLTMRFP